MKENPKLVAKTFKAKLERARPVLPESERDLGWVVIRIPFDVSKVHVLQVERCSS